LKYDENYQLGGLFGVQRCLSEDGISLGGGDLVNGKGQLVLNYYIMGIGEKLRLANTFLF